MAAAQDQIEGMTPSPRNTSVTTADSEQSETSLCRRKEVYSFGTDHVPKVRKPYTIRKQREKWTEEEHQKFLEALKRYGRGWRNIQEHVGTKTAVQIRSHAQKFFSKVVRESSGGTQCSPKPIEIPPPRPKRKPMHPYPRKSVDVVEGMCVSNKLERSPSPTLSVSEKENQSPTSVLSAIASDAVGSSVSEQHNACTSPTSCTTDLHSISLLPIEKKSEHLLLNSSAGEEKGYLLSVQLSSGPLLEKFLSMKFELDSDDSVCAEGDTTLVHTGSGENVLPAFASIKLFGKTVMVDCQKSSSGIKPFSSKVRIENLDVDDEKPIQKPASKQLDTQLSLGMVNSNSNAMPSGLSVYQSMKLGRESANSLGTNSRPLWWVLCQGPPFLGLASYDQTPPQKPSNSCMEKRSEEKKILKERSCTGSNMGSVAELENRERNLDDADSQFHQPSAEGKVRFKMLSKGVVPYKRCLEDLDTKSAVTISEERELQRARVCS